LDFALLFFEWQSNSISIPTARNRLSIPELRSVS